jgi:hypothetical protein
MPTVVYDKYPTELLFSWKGHKENSNTFCIKFFFLSFAICKPIVRNNSRAREAKAIFEDVNIDR